METPVFFISFTQRCGNRRNQLTVKAIQSRILWIKLVTVLNETAVSASYAVIHKLTALIIIGVDLFKNIKNY